MHRLGLAVVLAAACGPAGAPPAAPAPGAAEPVDVDFKRAEARPAPAAPQAQQARGEARTARPASQARYRGSPIDLDLKDADLHNVFRLLAEAGGANLVVADDVRGTLTLRLRGVPWDQALHTVARMKRLRVERQGDVFVITRASR
jgi:type IV pilus assembly protein PilQ